MRLRRPPVVVVSETAIAAASAAAERSLPDETGGILLGWREADVIRVERAVEVADALATGTGYTRDRGRAQATLETLLTAEPEGSDLGYVGEWHSHPAPQPPSGQDRRELRRIGRRVKEPVAMLVLASDGANGWQIHALSAVRRTIDVHVVSDGSAR